MINLIRRVLLGSVLVFVTSTCAGADAQNGLSIEQVKDGLYTIIGSGGNVGVRVTPEGVILIDDKFPRNFMEIQEKVAEVTDQPVRYVINTHHHGDHTAGNAVLAPVADLHVAHEAVPGLQRARAVGSDGYATQRYADETFRETWRADLGDEVLALHYFGPAHTCGDAVVHFERADVVHMGDLVFNRRQPFIDRAGGASVEAWGTLLETVHSRFSDETAFVFGHAGDGFPVIGTRADLLTMRDFLAAARRAIVPRAADGAVEKGFAGFGAQQLQQGADHHRNVADIVHGEVIPGEEG